MRRHGNHYSDGHPIHPQLLDVFCIYWTPSDLTVVHGHPNMVHGPLHQPTAGVHYSTLFSAIFVDFVSSSILVDT